MGVTTEQQPGTEVARRGQALAPLDLAQTRAAMQTYQQGLQELLDDTDRQQFTTGDGQARDFVKRSGWRKIATWFGLSLEVVSIDIDRMTNGQPIRARVIARAIAPNGRYADGDGACDRAERSFSKPEHDIAATATTRATNRAIANLVGMGAVSAEEIDGTSPPSGSRFGAVADERTVTEAIQAIRDIVGGDGANAAKFIDTLGRSFGPEVAGLPEAAGKALKGLAWWVNEINENKTNTEGKT